MDDSLMLADTKEEAMVTRDLITKLLNGLGLEQNEKQGIWEPVQVTVHLGLEIDTCEGVFPVTEQRLENINQQLNEKVAELRCDNQAVVAMLGHFTSREPELMRGMKRLQLLLDFHDIDLRAYIHREANEWAGRLSHMWAIDDWRLCDCVIGGSGGRTWWTDLLHEFSAQLPRYYSALREPGAEGIDALMYQWGGEVNWMNPPWSVLDEVARKFREEGVTATVAALY
eukprot:gene34150-biopygen16474